MLGGVEKFDVLFSEMIVYYKRCGGCLYVRNPAALNVKS